MQSLVNRFYRQRSLPVAVTVIKFGLTLHNYAAFKNDLVLFYGGTFMEAQPKGTAVKKEASLEIIDLYRVSHVTVNKNNKKGE